MRGIETQQPINSKVHHPKELRKNQLMKSLTYVTVVEGLVTIRWICFVVVVVVRDNEN